MDTQESQDDVVVVNDEVNESTTNEIVDKVAKMLEPGEEPEITDDTHEVKEVEEVENTEVLNEELQSRAESIGIPKELAQRLHESGSLEETLVAFDKQMIDRFSEVQPEKVEVKETETTKVVAAEPISDLDPEVYDDEIVKRDAYYKQRIDSLEAKLSEIIQERQDDFDKKFDEMVDTLGMEDVFGKIGSISEEGQSKRDVLYKSYMAMCNAFNANPEKCDRNFGLRAAIATFPENIVKKTQQETVKRLRDAEGKFLTSSKPKGKPPYKDMTEEESSNRLVSEVEAYYKEHGIPIYGY